MRELDRLDREHGLGAMPGTPVRRQRRTRRRGGSPAVAGLAITALLLGGVVMVGPGDEFRTARRLLGLGPDQYGDPPAYTPGEGPFAFLQTQRGSDTPVGYDPCRPIEYVVNPDGAPSDWQELVDTGIAHTEWASGLELEYAGTTSRRPFDANRSGSLLGTAQPVVIGFADEDEIDALAGDIAGVGGSVAQRDALGRDYYVTGAIALDTDVFDGSSWGDQRSRLQAIVDHELGHVVGLDHVEDPGELMNGENLGRTTYGPGDLEGFARLGSIRCR